MKVLMSGNEAVAEAAIRAGCRFYYGYPITPQNEIPEYMSRRMREVGGTFIQSESELAAINMVLGSSVAGFRAMTSSSGLGMALKQEGICYCAGCELPAFVVDVMRGGPALGNIGPSQGDYFQATRGGGTGDYHTIVLAPASVQEIVDLTTLGFDLADLYRIPVVMLCDGILGQMMEPVEFHPPRAIDLPPKDWALTGCKGRKPRIIRSLYLGEGVLERHNERLQKKYQEIRQRECRWECVQTECADVLLVAYGTPSRLCRAALDQLREEGVKAGLFRPITLWPFPAKALCENTTSKTLVVVVEMNYGQMVEDVRLALNGKCDAAFCGHGGGEVMTVQEVLNGIRQALKERNVKASAP